MRLRRVARVLQFRRDVELEVWVDVDRLVPTEVHLLLAIRERDELLFDDRLERRVELFPDPVEEDHVSVVERTFEEVYEPKLCWPDDLELLLQLFDEVARLILRVNKEWPLLRHDLVHDERIVDRLHIVREPAVLPVL